MVNVTQAAGAYLNTLNQMKNPAAGGTSVTVESSPTTRGEGFGDMLKQSIESAVQAQHVSEKMSTQAMMGKADMTDVLQAVTNAEMALNTVLAIRDKVVQAYEQIIRTPI